MKSIELVICFLVLLILLSAISRNYVDIFIEGLVLLNLISHQFLYPDLVDYRHIVQTSAFSALSLLHVTLLMGPLSKFSKRFAPSLKHRRHIGVSVFLLGLIHSFFVIANYYKFDPKLIYSIEANLFGSTTLLILTALAGTSTNYFQSKVPVRIYNLIHTGLLASYILYILILNILGFTQLVTWQILSLLGIILVWSLILPWTLPRKLFIRVNGWKQLHFLVYLAYFALIIHSWTGYFQYEKLAMQLTFWVPFVVVAAVHIAGWTRKLQAKSRMAELNANPPSLS